MPRFLVSVGAVLILMGTNCLFAQDVPKGYTVPDITLSSDHKYGVLVPKRSDDADDDALKRLSNQVIEMSTGHILGSVEADIAYEHMNHEDLAPTRWTADNCTLLWLVDGKWGYFTELLIKLENGKIQSQVNVLDLLQKEMLKRMQAAVPAKYAVVKKENEGDGNWFKDGFAIDCVPDEQKTPLKFPLTFHCFLTSDTKSFGERATVDARMTAELNADGTIKVKKFYLGKNPPSRTWE